jgi:hemoglobin-like flavoprotein
MLTPDQLALVQDSFAVLGPKAERLAARFYSRLFELDPTLRSLFPADLAPQHCKFAEALAAVVKALSRPGQLIPLAEELGRRHARYGIADEQYQAVGEALIWAVSKTLGPEPNVEAAWSALYSLIIGAMKEGTRAQTAPPDVGRRRSAPPPRPGCPPTGSQPMRPRRSIATW